MFAGLVLITVALMARVSALKVLDSAVHYGFSQYKDRCTAIAIGTVISSHFPLQSYLIEMFRL